MIWIVYENQWEGVKPAVGFFVEVFQQILLLAQHLSNNSACLHWKWLCNITKCECVKL